MIHSLKNSLAENFWSIVLWSTLLLGGYLCLPLPLFVILVPPIHQAPMREHFLSIFGFLPVDVVYNYYLFCCLKLVYVVAACFWALRRALPLSPLVATLSFTFVTSMYMESLIYTKHQCHPVCMVMIVLAAWFTFYAKELRSRGWTFHVPDPPNWVMPLIVFYLASIYSFSGMTKLAVQGWHWANGLSLQLWLATQVSQPDFLTRFLLEHRSMAMLAQALTLSCEAGAFLMLLFPRLRLPIGAMLLGFHLVSEATFDYGFYGNIAYLWLFLIVYPTIGGNLTGPEYKQTSAAQR